MARVTYGSLVTELKGSIGGTTFQSNAYGFTAKNKANMVKPNTEWQNRQKVIMSLCTRSWNTITPVQRLTWDNWAAAYPQYAKNNPSSILSGFAAFVKWHSLNFLGFGFDAAILPSPAFSLLEPDTVTDLQVENSGLHLRIGVAWSRSASEWNVLWSVSRPMASSQTFVGSNPRFMKCQTSADGAVEIDTQYIAQFGAWPLVGQEVVVSWKMFAVDTGQNIATTTQRVLVV